MGIADFDRGTLRAFHSAMEFTCAYDEEDFRKKRRLLKKFYGLIDNTAILYYAKYLKYTYTKYASCLRPAPPPAQGRGADPMRPPLRMKMSPHGLGSISDAHGGKWRVRRRIYSILTRMENQGTIIPAGSWNGLRQGRGYGWRNRSVRDPRGHA